MSDSKSPKVVLQGDLAFVPMKDEALVARIRYIAPQPNLGQKFVLARGEKSGHTHTIEATSGLRVLDPNEVFWPGVPRDVAIILAGDEGSVVVHDEHLPALLEPNTVYALQRQRDYQEPEPRTSMRDTWAYRID